MSVIIVDTRMGYHSKGVPNSAAPGALDPQPWALPDVAAYLSLNWKMRQAFDYSETLMGALADDKGAFKRIFELNGRELDPKTFLRVITRKSEVMMEQIHSRKYTALGGVEEFVRGLWHKRLMPLGAGFGN